MTRTLGPRGGKRPSANKPQAESVAADKLSTPKSPRKPPRKPPRNSMSAPYEPPPPPYDPTTYGVTPISYPAFGAPEPPADYAPFSLAYPYTKRIADEILYRIAAGETIKQICADVHLPSRTTFLSWVEDDIPRGLSDAYQRARRIQAECSGEVAIDRIIRLAVEGERVQLAAKDGTIAEGLLRDPKAAEVLLKAQQWWLGISHPKKYGAKATLTITDPGAAKSALARLLGVEPEQLPEE